MKGCPTDAFQVNERGIVVHVADACIGCQYCTWNCPYGVPVYQPDRKIVTKCDMCTNRLDEGNDPACVQACPSHAIEIEEVPLLEILETYQEAGAGPDMPDPSITIPSTKITLPDGVAIEDLKKVDRSFVNREDPHTPLIWMTVLTQLGLDGVVVVFLADLARTLFDLPLVDGRTLAWLAPFVIGVAILSLFVSMFHLGRPLMAYKAFKNWRTSWLSREVIGLSLFAGVAVMYASFLLLTEGLYLIPHKSLGGEPVRILLGAVTVVSGVAGVYCSSMIYRVPARPAWDSVKTTIDFFLVTVVLGPSAFVAAVALSAGMWGDESLYLAYCAQLASVAGAIGLVAMGGIHSSLIAKRALSDTFELSASAVLYQTCFFKPRAIKNASAGIGIAASLPIALASLVPASPQYGVAAVISLVALTTYCMIHRYLFFVTVVPRNIPGNFLMAAHHSFKTEEEVV